MPAVRNDFLMTKWIVFALLWFPLVSTAQTDKADLLNPERVVWRKAPIAIPLVVGEERLVHFPDSVSIGLPQSLTAVLRGQSINGTLYLLAKQPFNNTRVMVRSEPNGPMYVLDISAVSKDSERPVLPDVQIMLESAQENSEADSTDNYVTTDSRQASQWGYVALTRYAAQQLYAPSRLIPQGAGVVAMPVSTEPVNLLRGNNAEAIPVAAWKAGRYYVTAVKVTNRNSKALVLDPRELRGAWLAATFQNNRLLPAGSDADTTAVYLVSDRPFDVAL
jgi:integrating conjugative element protein (TIGR03749 family)